TGVAPNALSRSLRALTCSGVRVTRIRLPCKGRIVEAACSDMLLLLSLCRLCAIQCLDDLIGPLRKGPFRQQYSQLLSMFDVSFGRPGHTLLDTHLLLPIQADDQS